MSEAKTVSAMNARQQLGRLLDDVKFRGSEYVIEKNGQPAAVIIPVERHRQYLQIRESDFKRVETLRAKLKGDPTLEDDLQETAAEVRRG